MMPARGMGESMRFLLPILAVLLFAGSAQAQLTLCNRTAQPVQVAVTEDDIDEDWIEVRGWTAIAAGRCAKVSDSFLYNHAFFAFQPATGRTWEDDVEGPRLCVRMGRNFNIKYDNPGLDFEDVDDFDCPQGAVKRGFVVLANDADDVKFDLK